MFWQMKTEPGMLKRCEFSRHGAAKLAWREVPVVWWRSLARPGDTDADFWLGLSDAKGFPGLKTLYLRLSKCRASNADVERMFSKHSKLHTKLRSRLSEKSVRTQLLLHYYLTTPESWGLQNPETRLGEKWVSSTQFWTNLVDFSILGILDTKKITKSY